MEDTPRSKKTGAERTKEWREKNEQAARLSVLKFQVKTAQKREADSDFDKEYKERQAERKRRYREVKAAATERRASERKDSDEDTGKVLVEGAQKSRQAMVGLLQRKRTNKDKNDSIGSLLDEKRQMSNHIDEQQQLIQGLEAEVERLNNENAQLRTKMKENDLWLKHTFKYCTSETKKNIKTAYQVAASANELQKGNTLRLLRNCGINFSKKLPESQADKSELKRKVEKFAEENSSEMPDARCQKKGIRYRHHYLTCLHEDFKFCHPENEISYSTFSSYWPKNIIQPKPGDYANCVCEKCENPALKIRALKSHKLLPQEHELETVLRDIKMDNFQSEEELKNELRSLLEEPKASVQVKFLQWEKVETGELNKNTGRSKQATTQRVSKYASAKDLAVQTLTDYQLLKDHLIT